jgi:alpha-ketoglutarate-dependent taurine dioxygenase
MALETADLTPRIGTRIFIAKQAMLDGAHVQEIRQILERRGVILIRGVDLSDEEEIAFGATLGTVRSDFGGQPILRVTFDKTKNPEHANYFHGTFYWHMDATHQDTPPLASILTPRILSKEGGQTEFANTYAAYEDLPAGEKAKLEGLMVGHTQHEAFLAPGLVPTPDQIERIETLGTKVHPLVWTHRSGRKSLILGASGKHVVGMEKRASYQLIARLRAWMTQPQYVYTHHWQMGDVLMWDNTGTLHRVLPFDKSCDRRLHRVTLVGEEPITDTPQREAA